jgi:hypothetical protein
MGSWRAPNIAELERDVHLARRRDKQVGRPQSERWREGMRVRGAASSSAAEQPAADASEQTRRSCSWCERSGHRWPNCRGTASSATSDARVKLATQEEQKKKRKTTPGRRTNLRCPKHFDFRYCCDGCSHEERDDNPDREPPMKKRQLGSGAPVSARRVPPRAARKGAGGLKKPALNKFTQEFLGKVKAGAVKLPAKRLPFKLRGHDADGSADVVLVRLGKQEGKQLQAARKRKRDEPVALVSRGGGGCGLSCGGGVGAGECPYVMSASPFSPAVTLIPGCERPPCVSLSGEQLVEARVQAFVDGMGDTESERVRVQGFVVNVIAEGMPLLIVGEPRHALFVNDDDHHDRHDERAQAREEALTFFRENFDRLLREGRPRSDAWLATQREFVNRIVDAHSELQ